MKTQPCRRFILLFSVFALLAVSCRKGAEKIVFGSDTCQHCKMTVLDRRFGGEILNDNGKAFKFDSIDCLRAFKKSHPRETGGDKAQIFVLDGDGSGELLPIAEANFTEHPEMRPPMGKPWLAKKRESGATSAAASSGASSGISWDTLEKIMDQ